MIDIIINRISTELHNNFNKIADWFDVEKDLLNYVPSDGGWIIRKILEHISLTNHFLLILIKKGTLKALEQSRKSELSELLVSYDLDWEKLSKIGEHKSFEWNRPQHMEPGGTIEMTVLKNKLHQQLTKCLNYLNQLKNGEGVLYKTMMTVMDLGKIDVYHYIYFLALHAKRHLAQMNKVKIEFENR